LDEGDGRTSNWDVKVMETKYIKVQNQKFWNLSYLFSSAQKLKKVQAAFIKDVDEEIESIELKSKLIKNQLGLIEDESDDDEDDDNLYAIIVCPWSHAT